MAFKGKRRSSLETAALRTTGPMWRSVFDNAAIGMSLTEFSTRFVAANPAFQRLVGYSVDELRARTFLDLTYEDDRPAVMDLIGQLVAGQRDEIQLEKRCLRRDGQVMWARTSDSLIPGLDNLPRFILSVIEDFTERKGYQEELRRSETYLSAGQRISLTGTWVLAPNTGSLFWSKETFRICHFDPEKGTPSYPELIERIVPEDAVRIDQNIQTAMAAQAGFEGEYRLRIPGGGIKHIQYIGRPITSDLTGRLEYIGIIKDITSQKESEEKLSASRDQIRALATRLMQAQDEERRRIARELHDTTAQDLVALKMNLAALGRRQIHWNPADRALLAESAGLAEQAMNNVRTVSYVLHPPFLDEAGLESALRWYATGFARRSGIEVQLHLPPNLGRQPREIETSLFRVVQECLSNIHRHADSRTATIELKCLPDRLVLEVRDQGRGMDEEPDQERGIKTGSLGVGIAGMRERIEQLGGRLEIESSSQGTTVRAVLPPCLSEP